MNHPDHTVKSRVAAISIFASAGMAAAKFAVGIAIGSLALISEALHSSVDVVATVITWLVVRVSDRPADDEHHYGHGKFESLSALGVIAPQGASQKAIAAISAVPGVVDVERLRVRMVGSTHFIDAIVQVPRTYPIDRIDEIKRKAQDAVSRVLDDADLTFTAVPVARDNESVRERIMVIARNSGLAIHHVTVHDLGGKLTVSIDLEVDGDMALNAAHDIAHELERSIRDEFGEDVEVDTHIEPLEPELPLGADAAPDRVEAIKTALARFAAEGAIDDIHSVRVRNTDAGEIVNFHCRAAPSMSVIKVHENVDAIERALRRAFPTVKRVISHAEPPDAL
jgi:divalent metal cation (Fe/Co/Zn/Cd) transporter